LVRSDEVGELATTAPVHHMAGSSNEAVKRHTPVHDDLAVSGVRIAHPDLADSLRGRPREAAAPRRSELVLVNWPVPRTRATLQPGRRSEPRLCASRRPVADEYALERCFGRRDSYAPPAHVARIER